MAQEKRQLKTVEQDSPVMQARARIADALERIHNAFEARIQSAEEQAATLATEAPAAENDALVEQWQKAYAQLEEHAAQLQSDNEKLNGELHHAQKSADHLRAVTLQAEEKVVRVMGEISKILEA